MKVLINYHKIIPALLVLILAVLPHITFGAENYQAGDQLYVGSIAGLNVRNQPDIKAPILASLSYNTQVTIVADSFPSESFLVGVTDFNGGKINLSGKWVKVRSGKISGYVFDGMLTKFKGLSLKNRDEKSYFIALFGKPILKIIKKNVIVKGQKIPYEKEIKTYPRGLIEELTFFDSCYDFIYTYSVSFNEAYWLIQRMLWDADAAQEIKIKKINGKTVLSFYSCS